MSAWWIFNSQQLSSTLFPFPSMFYYDQHCSILCPAIHDCHLFLLISKSTSYLCIDIYQTSNFSPNFHTDHPLYSPPDTDCNYFLSIRLKRHPTSTVNSSLHLKLENSSFILPSFSLSSTTDFYQTRSVIHSESRQDVHRAHSILSQSHNLRFPPGVSSGFRSGN